MRNTVFVFRIVVIIIIFVVIIMAKSDDCCPKRTTLSQRPSLWRQKYPEYRLSVPLLISFVWVHTLIRSRPTSLERAVVIRRAHVPRSVKSIELEASYIVCPHSIIAHQHTAGYVSRCGLAVKRLAGKQKDLGSIRFGSPCSSLQKLWYMDTVL